MKNKMEENDEKEQDKKRKKRFFKTKKIATMGIMTALAFVVQFLEFPVFPAAPWLKLDFSGVFILLTGFLFGPVEGFIVCVLKELLHFPLSTSGGVGELANVIVMTSFLILPSTLYRFKKGLKVVIPSLIGAVLIMTAVSLPVNRFINYPFFMGDGAKEMFEETWQFVLWFNCIKGVCLALVTCILYKSLSRRFKRI